MYSTWAKKLALWMAFAWVAYGFVITMMAHQGIEKALIRAAMPGGLLLLAAIIAYSFPRFGSILLIAVGVAMYAFLKQEDQIKTAFTAIPPIAVGLFVIVAHILDNRGQ